MARQQIQLREGLALTLYADDLNARGQADELRVAGVVTYSEDEHCWVAVVDWSAIRHASDETAQSADGAKDQPLHKSGKAA